MEFSVVRRAEWEQPRHVRCLVNCCVAQVYLFFMCLCVCCGV